MTLVEDWRIPTLVQVKTTLVLKSATAIGPSTGRRTVTVKLQVFVLPQASRAVATTVLVVLGRNVEPDGGTEVMVTLLQVSVA